LQLRGLDVVEVDSVQEALKHLSEDENFTILVTDLGDPKHLQGYEWSTKLASDADGNLLVSILEPLDAVSKRIRAGRDVSLDDNSLGGSQSQGYARTEKESFLSWNPYEDDPYHPDPYAPR
jgi:CheY-like chemotaxis protein